MSRNALRKTTVASLVSIVSRVDHVLSKENMDADRACVDQKIAAASFVLLLVYRICGMQRRGTAFTKKRYEASGIDTSSNSGARGWTSFKRNILFKCDSQLKN